MTPKPATPHLLHPQALLRVPSPIAGVEQQRLDAQPICGKGTSSQQEEHQTSMYVCQLAESQAPGNSSIAQVETKGGFFAKQREATAAHSFPPPTRMGRRSSSSGSYRQAERC